MPKSRKMFFGYYNTFSACLVGWLMSVQLFPTLVYFCLTCRTLFLEVRVVIDHTAYL